MLASQKTQLTKKGREILITAFCVFSFPKDATVCSYRKEGSYCNLSQYMQFRQKGGGQYFKSTGLGRLSMATKWFFCQKSLKGPCSLHHIYNLSLLCKIQRRAGDHKSLSYSLSEVGRRKQQSGWEGSQRLRLLKKSSSAFPHTDLLALEVPTATSYYLSNSISMFYLPETPFPQRKVREVPLLR